MFLSSQNIKDLDNIYSATGFNMDQLCNRFECSDRLLYIVIYKKNINIVKFIFDYKYKTVVKKGFFKNAPNRSNGMMDSLRYVLSKAESNENVQVLKLLLKSF